MLYCQVQPNIRLHWIKQLQFGELEVQGYKDGTQFDFLSGSQEVEVVQFKVRHDR